MRKKYESRVTSQALRTRPGSALILAVVLTSLLAVVGVIFVMSARVDKVATSSISENRELNFAVESVIAKLSQELVLDVPGMLEGTKDYYDYPDANNAWLACLEPYDAGAGNYKWRQISDVTGYIARNITGVKDSWKTQDIEAEIIEDREKIILDSDGNIEDQSGAQGGQLADADGDGVADSKWIVLDDITSAKGTPIYAAIRVVDNGAMLNVNTAYKFDANETDLDLIDGSSQMQINLLALSERGSTANPQDKLDDARFGSEPQNPDSYIKDVVWRYYLPYGEYTPFDISDEMELRNRYFLNHPDIVTRLEDVWSNAFKPGKRVPRNKRDHSISEPNDWFWCVNNRSRDPNKYNYRHIATTYNMDRIINRIGGRLININREINAENLYDLLRATIDPNIVDSDSDRERLKRRFAQLAVNIADYVDEDIDVKVFEPPDPEDHEEDEYYGFEAQPFISEVAMVIDTFPDIGPSYFAVELYNPFDRDINLEDFELELYNSDVGGIEHTVTFSNDDVIKAGSCFVISNNPDAFYIYGLTDDYIKEDNSLKFFGGWKPPTESVPPRDRRRDPDESKPPRPTGWQNDTSLRLKRELEDGTEIYVDGQFLDRSLAPADEQRAYGRDCRDWHIIYQTLEEDEGRGRSRGSLGRKNDIDPAKFRDRGHNFSFFLPKPIDFNSPPLRPYNKFRTVGDIARILTIGNSTDSEKTIGEQLEQKSRNDERDIRLDLENPYHRNIFQYLTVFDPTADGIDNDGDKNTDESDFTEYQIAGRININTAPWYVIKQLPWVSEKLAQAIVAYRDKLDDPINYQSGRYNAINNELDGSFDRGDIREALGFASIGELNFVIDAGIAGDEEYSIAKYALDNDELRGFPDLTTDRIGGGDGIEDDFEERDIIFSRISNLVTVRSDVFTAYILVRIGADGPQKRVIAILDRSNVYTGNGKVRIVAQHFVPDPR